MVLSICLLSVVPLRKEPAHRSEMVSQLLFGEYADIVGEEESFVKVKCLYDGYEGWVQANQLERIGKENIIEAMRFTSAFISGVRINHRAVRVPFATPVLQQEQASLRIAGNEIEYTSASNELWDPRSPFTEENLEKAYRPYLDAPYLWGGKSVFGIDCSGFVQQVFKLFGIKLLRDAYLQAEQGSPVQDLTEAQPGDLAFFHNEKGRITHVGIILSDHKIVHASGRVRIDTIDKDGILNSETGTRSHQLHSIRRIN
jgi:hypothetical protein